MAEATWELLVAFGKLPDRGSQRTHDQVQHERDPMTRLLLPPGQLLLMPCGCQAKLEELIVFEAAEARGSTWALSWMKGDPRRTKRVNRDWSRWL